MTPEIDGFPDSIGAGDNVLVFAPAIGETESRACGAMLDRGSPDQLDFIAVALNRDPARRLDVWREYVHEEPPTRSGLVCVEAVTNETGDVTHSEGERWLETVADPSDLTGIGMRVSDLLEAWQSRDTQLVTCFHTLTTLLQFSELVRVFRFLHVLTARLRAVGAVSHFHLDPVAHTQQTISRIEQVFDAVVDASRPEDWQIRHR